MAKSLRVFFQSNGLPAIGLLSLVENLVVANIYFPGSVVILLAMSLTAGNLQLAFVTFLWIIVPSAFAHAINYGIGRFGGAKVAKLTDGPPGGEPSMIEFALAFGHPHTAAFVSFRAGSSRMPPKRYISRFLPVSLAWSTFWAIVMYNVGGSVGGVAGYWIYLIYAYLILWAAWDLWKWRRRQYGLPISKDVASTET